MINLAYMVQDELVEQHPKDWFCWPWLGRYTHNNDWKAKALKPCVWCWMYYVLHAHLPRSTTMVQIDPPSQLSNVDPTSSIEHTCTSFVGLTHYTSLRPWFLTQVPPTILWVTNLCFLLYLLRIVYLQLPWLMDLRSYPMVLVLLLFFLLCPLVMFFLSPSLHLTYYP